MHLYWKRGLTACMAAALLTGAMPALAWEAPSDNNWQAANREGVAARFFVGSDVHIGRNADASAKLTNALNVFNEIDPQADGVLLVGDITNNGASGEYDTLMDLIHASPLSDKVVLAMGNHEFKPSWARWTASRARPARTTTRSDTTAMTTAISPPRW